MIDAPLRFMRRLSAGGSVSGEGRAALLAILSPPTAVPADTDLMVVGEPLRHGYVVEDGWGCRYRVLHDGRRQILNFMLPGDYLGASSDLMRSPDHSVATLTGCRIYRFPVSMLTALERSFPELRDAFDRSERRDLSLLLERIVDLGRRNARERVARLILELHQRLCLVGLSAGQTFDFPLTQETLADALGLSIVHVNRTLRRLKAEGLIDYRSGQIIVQQRKTLASIAEFDDASFAQAKVSHGAAAAIPTQRYGSAGDVREFVSGGERRVLRGLSRSTARSTPQCRKERRSRAYRVPSG